MSHQPRATTGADGAFLLSLVRGARYHVSAQVIIERDGRPVGTQSAYAIVEAASDAPPIAITVAPRPPEPPARAIAPTKVKDVRPVFPLSAQQDGVSGTVILEATIGEDGRVRDARVLQSVASLDQAALEAVRQWECTPARLGGEPIAVLPTVTIPFALE